MEILSEKTKKVVNMECEFEDKEYDLLYHYAKDNIPTQKLNDLLISWAVSDILRKHIAALTKKPAIKKKTGKEKVSKAAVKRKAGK